MMGFASNTGTKRNLAGLKREGWGVLVTPFGDQDPQGLPYIIDNGAWRAFQRFLAGQQADKLLDVPLFLGLLRRMGGGALAVILPDIVGEGAASLALSAQYEAQVRFLVGPRPVLLLAVQDGMENMLDQVEAFMQRGCGIFVGGTTAWKEATLPVWAAIARKYGCWLHVGRVNTARRIALCAAAGATSFDGTSATKYASTLPMLAEAARQPALIPMNGGNMSPADFAMACRSIVAGQRGHEAHRSLDLLTNDVLRQLGFGEGIDVFEAAVRSWHETSDPYPYSGPCPACERPQRSHA